MSGDVIVELDGIGKTYGANRVLDDVSVEIRRGRVHALVGENGAGKSTLGRIIGGEVPHSTGTLKVDGRSVHQGSPREALARGLVVIQQEPTLVATLTVEQNVFLGQEQPSVGVVSRRRLRERFERLAARLPFALDPQALVSTLSIADQQKIEIMRAVARDARVIVMDEPTSSLGVRETEVLHDVVRGLCREGVAVVYVSHFLEEVLEIADDVTVLRNGRRVACPDRDRLTVPALVEAMLGRPVGAVFPDRSAVDRSADPVLVVDGLSTEAVDDISFRVWPGEVVGLGGLVGSGRSEVLRAIFGVDRRHQGTVTVGGEPVRSGSVQAAIARGIGLIPEDRADEGLLLGLSQKVNLTLTHLRRLCFAGVPRASLETPMVTSLLTRLEVRPLDPRGRVGNLSGGNQQKILFGRWMTETPRVLLLDEPTRGVDIGAKVAIYRLIAELSASGVACVIVSSDSEELVGLAHRVHVMRRGHIVDTVEQEHLSVHSIMSIALGVVEGAA